jgi:hypothetical protein
VHRGFWLGNLSERGHLEDPGLNGKIILKWIFEKMFGGGDMDWVGLSYDTDRWQTLVNAVMNLRVPQYAGNFLTI